MLTGPIHEPRTSLDALRAQAMSLHLNGSLAGAAQLYARVLHAWPDDFQALLMSGVLAAQGQRAAEAAGFLRRALAVDPASPLAHNNLGIVLTELGLRTEAIASFDRALALSPEYAEAHCNRGVTLAQLNRPQEALAAHERAIALQPEFAAAHLNRAVVLLRSFGRYEEALRSADRAIELAPGVPEALVARGDALQELQRAEDALRSYQRALALQPTHATALSHLGAVLCDLGRPAEALAYCQQALTLEPDLTEALVNRGIALQDLQRYAEALASYDAAIAHHPDLAAAHNNRGNVLQQLQRHEEALASFEKSIALGPENAEAHFNKSLCLLLLGRMQSAWPLYEWRKRRRPPVAARVLPQPEWRGATSLEGRSLLLHSEQGLGDTIQFCRYAHLAQTHGARVILSVPASLQRLLRTLGPGIDVVTPETEPATDYHAPLLSLPAAFGTTLQSIPASIPYLSAEPDRVAQWRRRIGGDGFRIGVAWQGRAGKADIGRSFPLELLQRLADVEGVRLISLQKQRGAEQLQALPTRMRVEQLGEDFDAGGDAFLDTAAVMECLDLVIAADTAVGHLAGALGTALWLALRAVPDWRWMLERDDSPWYPSARLFRQRRSGDWGGVFEEMHRELRGILDARKARRSGDAVARCRCQ